MPPHRTLRAARDRDAAVPTDDISGSSDTDPAPATRPNISYAHLAAMAIDASLEKRCTVAEIYTWIEEKFPFFRTRNGSPSWWKNCIRHNLSMKKSFVRLPGNGANLWAIHPAHHEELFSVKQRRRSNLTSSDTLPPGPTTSPQQQQQQQQQQQYDVGLSSSPPVNEALGPDSPFTPDQLGALEESTTAAATAGAAGAAVRAAAVAAAEPIDLDLAYFTHLIEAGGAGSSPSSAGTVSTPPRPAAKSSQLARKRAAHTHSLTTPATTSATHSPASKLASSLPTPSTINSASTTHALSSSSPKATANTTNATTTTTPPGKVPKSPRGRPSRARGSGVTGRGRGRRSEQQHALSSTHVVPADDLEDDCDAHQDSNNNNTTSEFVTAMDGDHSLLTHGHGHGHLHAQGTGGGYMHASQVTLLPPILSHALPPQSLSVPAPRPRPDEIWLGEMRSPSPGLAGLGLGINFGGYPGRFTEHFSGGIAAMLAPPKMPLAPMPASSATRGTTPTHARCPTPIQRVLFAGSPDLDTYKDPFFPPIEFSLYT